mmetsp:Transcript_28310/g.44162  ORF Transcript_28310/g.44162 Transcript_28310/m.44162 type:complete len:95 (-) Transcript_28310:677-961(-)
MDDLSYVENIHVKAEDIVGLFPDDKSFFLGSVNPHLSTWGPVSLQDDATQIKRNAGEHLVAHEYPDLGQGFSGRWRNGPDRSWEWNSVQGCHVD